MWWKLVGVVVLTAALIFAVIPIRTHAVLYDPSKPPQRPSISDILSNMYLTPMAGLLIGLILVIAALVTVKVVRGDW